MRHRLVAAASVALGLALLAPPAEAVRSALRVYTSRDGLPQLQVTALCQDRSGYLWVGTLAGGVGRYDGRRFEIADAATGLPGSSIASISCGTGGDVFVGTTNGGAVFSGGVWSTLPAPPGPAPAVNALLSLEDGRVFAAASGGLFVARSPGAPWESVPAVGGLEGAEAVTLHRTADETLWVGTARGLGRMLPGGALTRYASGDLPRGSASVVVSGRNGGLLVGLAEVGLFALDPATGAAQRVGDDEMPGRNVSGLVHEPDGDGTWIATSDRGAFRWDGRSGFERLGPSEGLPDARVWSLLVDREGIVWLGTDSGLAKRGPTAFHTFGPEDGLPEASPLYGMAETPGGVLWFGAHDRGLLRRNPDGTFRLFTARDGLPHTEVRSFCVTPDGDLVATTFRGAVRIAGERVLPFRLPEGAPRAIDKIAFRPDGTLLLGSARQGLFVLRQGALSRLGPPVGDSVSVIHVGRRGTVWVGGPGWGAVALRDDAPPQALGTAEGLPSNVVTSILEDRRGGLWIATDRGLFHRTREGVARVLDARSGLPDSYVYWVGEEADGHVWTGTNRGAARIAPSGEMRVFTTNDGLGSDECNEDGFFADSKGRVWITTDGLSLFRGLPAPRRSVLPLVAVSEVRVGATRIAASRVVELPARHEPLTFRFAALSFLDEEATRFRYRLVGLSDSWTTVEPGQSETTYGGLGPGSYFFEVTATTVDGRQPAAPASVRVSVARPWWWRLPVVLGGLAAVLAILAVVFRIRERRLVVARTRLEKTVAERTEELRHLNAQLTELAITDSLTGLPNRRAILDSASEAFSLARRRRVPLALAMIDFDHFKEINDTLGHAEGDRLLVEGTRRMLEGLRTEDDLGRYGGEEFLAIFPMTDAEGAESVGERLRRAVFAVHLSAPVLGATTRDRASVSVGVATLAEGDTSLDVLLRRADAALYEAKQSGRNRVVVR
ncbi:MAG: diguanylate cyclase [Thermoanaerobaculia bacterium]